LRAAGERVSRVVEEVGKIPLPVVMAA